MKLKFTPVARDDLEQIWDYIAENNPQAATKMAQMLMQKCQLLAENPLLGRQRNEIAPNLRSFPTKSYTIFYRISVENLEIIRILNAARDIDNLF
jgi:toxin ParE1/3/4